MKTSKYRAVPLTVGLGLAVVTAAVPATAQPLLSLTHRAPAAKRVVLTNADDGRNVVLTAGDDVEVRLNGSRAQGLNYTWSIPQSSTPSVLRRTAGGTTTTGGASAVFHAERLGVATFSSARHCRPDPGRVCPLVVVPWKVTAEVK